GCTGLMSVTIPNSVTSIGWGAFKGCTGLTLVMIPTGATSIGDYAFQGCTALSSIPTGITYIGWGSFQGCTGLTSVTIPNSATSIGDYAFQGCMGLTSVAIPSSVKNIGQEAFSGCTKLLEVICMSSTPPISSHSNIFDNNTYNNGTLYLPIGSVNLYATTSPWSSFLNIIEKDLTEIKLINNAQNVYSYNKSIIVENDNSSVDNINVYSHDGMLVKSITTDEKHTEIPLNKSGMYIVKTNAGIQKIIVK
nr:leucine-rich repeat domain-containing protein [Prevotella sp.]